MGAFGLAPKVHHLDVVPTRGGYCHGNRARHGWGAAPEQMW
jgi:hypothetical protein